MLNGPHLSFFSNQNHSELSIGATPRLGPGRHDGNLPVLVGGLHRAVGHHLQLVVLLVGFGVLGAPGACWGLGTGELSIHGFFEDFYTHYEPYVFGLLVGDET